MKLFESLGLKRKFAALLSFVATLLLQSPQFAPYALVLQKLAAALGLVGVVHATTEGTVTTFSLGSISALVSILVTIATYIPALHQFIPYLLALSAALSGGTVATAIATPKIDAAKEKAIQSS